LAYLRIWKKEEGLRGCQDAKKEGGEIKQLRIRLEMKKPRKFVSVARRGGEKKEKRRGALEESPGKRINRRRNW